MNPAIDAQKKYAWISLFVCLIGAGMFAAPIATDMDMNSGGGALIMAGLLVGITAFCVAIMFFFRARTARKIASGEKLLTVWEHTVDDWNRFVVAEQALEGRVRYWLIRVISFFVVVGCGVFAVLDHKAAPFMIGLGCALLALFWFVYWVAPSAVAPARPGDKISTYISPDGIIVNGTLHSWTSYGSSLDSVGLIDAGGARVLEFNIVYQTNKGTQTQNVHIPVPPNEEESAGKIVEYFQKKLEKAG